ncbi:MAG TPA: cell wall anchor protein [Roseiarcus sp.]|nr:cell wall anchor protein [Roseiarcus sp.]
MRNPFRAGAAALALAAVIAVGGCNVSSVNGMIAADASKSLPTTCSLGAAAHAAFATIAATGKLKLALVSQEAAAFAGLQSLCRNPPTDVASMLIEAASIYATITASLKSARQ